MQRAQERERKYKLLFMDVKCAVFPKIFKKEYLSEMGYISFLASKNLFWYKKIIML